MSKLFDALYLFALIADVDLSSLGDLEESEKMSPATTGGDISLSGSPKSIQVGQRTSR